jgi:hypothetical protein
MTRVVGWAHPVLVYIDYCGWLLAQAEASSLLEVCQQGYVWHQSAVVVSHLCGCCSSRDVGVPASAAVLLRNHGRFTAAAATGGHAQA